MLIDDEAGLAAIVRAMRTVAVVGMKDERDAGAPAYSIPKVVQARGVRVIPVNPKLATALGEPAHASLAAIGAPVDMVNVFRRSDAVGPLADEILALPAAHRPRVVWMQTDVRNDDAAARLTAAGIDVVMDRCLGVYAVRYLKHI